MQVDNHSTVHIISNLRVPIMSTYSFEDWSAIRCGIVISRLIEISPFLLNCHNIERMNRF